MNTVISSKLAAAAVGVVAASLVSASAFAADATGSASAVVAAPIAITAGTAMTFGNVAVGAAGGTAVLTTADALTVTGDVSALSGVTPASGAFNVTGEGTSAYSVTLPTTISLTGPGTAMTISTIGHSAGASPALLAGASSFKIGGTLAVGAAQAPGTYSSAGGFTVTVNYQ